MNPENLSGQPYVPSLLVELRKRLDDEVLAQINEMIIAYNKPDEFCRQHGIRLSGSVQGRLGKNAMAGKKIEYRYNA